MRDDRDLLELLDAHLDGELSADEEQDVQALLARSPEARDELASIDRVRRMVRGLPEVDAPFGFYERLTSPRLAAKQAAKDRDRGARRQRRAPGLGVAVAGIAAAVALIAVGLTPSVDQIVPDLTSFEERHDTMMASSSQPVDDSDYEPMPTESLDGMDPYRAPDELSMGYTRMSVYDGPDVWQVVYSDGEHMVSVFQQEGMVDWSGMPADGDRTMLGDDKAWQAGTNDAQMVVLERDGLVVTVVGSIPDDHAMMVAESIPDPPDPSFTDRAADACRELTSAFGFPA